jgi:protoporphyrinogen oxidase
VDSNFLVRGENMMLKNVLDVYFDNKLSKYKSYSTVILGGGLSGLSYAYGNLIKGNSTIIFEKREKVGGHLITFDFNGFLFDFGPHIFRSRDEKVLIFVKQLLRNNYHYVSSNPAIYKYGRIYDNVIPVITFQNIENLPPEKRDKAKQEICKLNRNLSLNNFEECIISQIGQTLYEEFFKEYTEKWWGVPPKQLSADIAPKNLAIGRDKFYAHITTNFERALEEIYPLRGGIFEIARMLKNEVEKLGGYIVTRSNVKKLELDGDEIAHVVIEREGEEIEVETIGRLLVSTIPLTNLCDMLGIQHRLKYRGDICVFLAMKGNQIFNHSWIYFHDKDIIFGRVYEPLYYSKFNAPSGYTSLCVEITCFKDDSTWKETYLGDKVVEQLLDLGMIKKNQEPKILGIRKDPFAYPLFTIGYEKELEKVFSELNLIRNLRVIGRAGSFKYLNMNDCIKWALC